MRAKSEKLDWTGVKFPTPLEDIDIFEENNPYVINVLVLEYDDKVYPLRLSKKYDSQVIYLLLLMSEYSSHYCWVKDISKLMARQDSRHHGRRHYCSRCIGSFYSKKILDKSS